MNIPTNYFYKNEEIVESSKTMVRLEGNVTNGLLNGPGKKIHPNGIVEEGNFVNGELDGDGKISFPDGSDESGIFKKGKLFRGSKRIVHADGKIEFQIYRMGSHALNL